MRGQTLALTLLLLWRRRQTRSTLTTATSYYASKETVGTGTDRWRGRLLRAVLGAADVRALAGTTSSFELLTQTRDIILVPMIRSWLDTVAEGEKNRTYCFLVCANCCSSS
jgi:hypothetical protein